MSLLSFGRNYLCRFGSRSVVINPLDVSHRSGVADTTTELDDAGVSTLARCGAWGDFGEEGFDGVLLPELASGKTAGVEISTLAQGHQFLGERANGFRLGESGLDAFVLDEAANLIGEQGITMGRAAA